MLNQLSNQAWLRNSGIAFVVVLVSLASALPSRADGESPLKPSPGDLRLQAACHSTDPVLVIDNFPISQSATNPSDFSEAEILLNPKGRIVDIDGDGIPELFHGELVEAIARQSGHKTERLNMEGSLSLPELAEFLEPVVEEIESGKKRYSRINLSQENPLRLSAFKADLFPDDPTFPEIDATNIAQYRDRIFEKFWQDRPDLKIKELSEIFRRLEKAGVPVIVAGGNFGPSFVNLFSMMPGVLTVGSLDHKGDRLHTSANNSLVRHWVLGVVVPKMAGGGVDINGDGKPDFPKSQLTDGTPIVSAYHGKPVSTMVQPVDRDFRDWLNRVGHDGLLVPNAALNVIDPGLYKVSEIVSLPTVNQPTANMFRSLGEFALKRKDGPPRIFFTSDRNGILRFDPKGDGSEGQLTRIPGTSFAAPAICNK